MDDKMEQRPMGQVIQIDEARIEMYLAGVSVRRVEDITEALWGTRVSPSTVSNLNKKIYAKIEAWRHRPIYGTLTSGWAIDFPRFGFKPSSSRRNRFSANAMSS